VLSQRWIAELTFSGLVRYSRHARDYDRSANISEATIRIAMPGRTTRRRARQNYI